jgi:arsenate reductase
MFGVAAVSLSTHHRVTGPHLLAEAVATFGLVLVVFGVTRSGRTSAAPFAVGAYIAAAYWFTSSTSFANPAVTLARAATDTFAGIRPADAPAFILAQLLGAAGDGALPLAGAGAARRGSRRAPRGGAMKRVIFACVHNAGRSQMAAALFNKLADPAKAIAVSAGTRPGDRVHPAVVEAMKELGVDLSRAVPQRLTAELARGAEFLVTMGCGDECPVVPGARREDWPLEDPKGQPLERVRQIRDEIRDRVRALLSAEGLFATP